MRMRSTPSFFLGACFYLSLLITSVAAAQNAAKTPMDTYRLAQSLTSHTDTLRQLHEVTTPWPEPPLQQNKTPRHVLQKALEVLKKIGRLRQINGMGPISIPPYPARNITPNEVFDMVKRLNTEIILLLPLEKRPPPKKPKTETAHKTPNDVYRAIWRISLALDPLLGVRGFTPRDVYAQTEQILGMVRFLRFTQNLPDNIKQPPRPKGKHPNHALQAAYALLTRIAKAEENLWIEPAHVPKLERRVITPTEVYDALSNVTAELQRIKYRLGVERHFPEPTVKADKSPDDVVQNLQWAAEMMPQFSLGRPLYQHDPASLTKTSDDVYLITEHILDELSRYRALRGIHTAPRQPTQATGLQPKHVYQKILEGVEKTNVLRQQMQMGTIALPEQPLHRITPTEVFDLATRLDMELQYIYDRAKLEETTFIGDVKRANEQLGKTPSDAYTNMWHISYLLDTIIGSEGYTPNDLYRESMTILNEIKLITHHLKRGKIAEMPNFVEGHTPQDVMLKARDLLILITRTQDRAGLFEKHSPIPMPGKDITSSDVFNMVGLIHAELNTLKLHLGISEYITPLTDDFHDKTLSHVYQLLSHAYTSLSYLLSGEQASSEEAGP